jgi:hypothetical protein
MRESRADEDAASEKKQVEVPPWTAQVTSEPGTATHTALVSILEALVKRMMTDTAAVACPWSANDTRQKMVPPEVSVAVNGVLRAALMANTWKGLGCNRTHAFEGRGTLRVCSWVLTPCRAGPGGWIVPTKPSTCPAALWIINLALSAEGRYSVIYNNGVSSSTLELRTQGEVYAFQGKHLDADRVTLVPHGETRLVILCVGLAWNEPLEVHPGEHLDDHDPRI